MIQDEGPAPEPITGEVIPTSSLKTVGMFLFCLALIPLTGYLLWDRWGGGNTLPFMLTWYGTALAVIGFFIGLMGTITFPFLLLYPLSLILGKEALQVVRKSRSGFKVIAHLPYENIATVDHEKPGEDDPWRIGIDVHNSKDANTYTQKNDYDHRKRTGRDYCIDGGWTVSLKSIAAKIESRCAGLE